MIDVSNLSVEPMPENGGVCGRCAHWKGLSSIVGQCRRMPPVADFESGHFWPMTGRSDWCGEFGKLFSTKAD